MPASMGPWADAMNRQANPNARPSYGPGSWNTFNRYQPLDHLSGLLGNLFGGGATGAMGGASGAPGPGVGPMNVQTPFRPAPVYDPTSLQIARNQIRSQVPSALSSGIRHTPAGVSSTLGHESGIMGQQYAGQMGGEDAVQKAMLQARMANARNMLAGQTGAVQSGLGMAGGMMDRLGIGQGLRYGLANQGLTRGNMGLDFLMGILNYL